MQPQPAPSVGTAVGPGPGAPTVNDKLQLEQLIKAVERARNSRVLVYWLTDMARVSEAVATSLYDQLEAIGHVPRLDLVLSTRGGDTEAPWRIVSLIREYCDHFGVLVPYRCSSAGTMIALGADEIVMTALGALGPIDPSRGHPLLPLGNDGKSELISVQDMRHAMQFVRQPTGPGVEMSYTPEAMAQIFSALFDKIHPLAIGAIEQSYALAKLVAKMCLETHMDAVAEAPQIEAIVNRLCDEYKSHAFQINRGEARAAGLKVVEDDPAVTAGLVDLLKFYSARPLFPSLAAPPTRPTPTTGNIAWLDSTALHLRAEAQYIAQPDGTAEHKGDAWVAY